MSQGSALALPATQILLVGHLSDLSNLPVFQTGEVPKNAGKKVPSVAPRYRVWCHSVFLVLSQFSPVCTPDSQGQGDRYGPEAGAVNVKKPQENLGFLG